MVEVDVEDGNVTAKAFYKPGSSDRISYPPLDSVDERNNASVVATSGSSVVGSDASGSVAATGNASVNPSMNGSQDLTADATKDSTESNYSIKSTEPIKIDGKSITISDTSVTQLNSILFPEESERDHILLIDNTGEMMIVTKDMHNPMDPAKEINKTDNITRVDIHVPDVGETLQYGDNGPTFTIKDREPGNFTYMYTLEKKDGTPIKATFNFFDIFPLTNLASKDEESRSVTDGSSNMSAVTQSAAGGQLKRQNRRRVTRRRSNRRRRVQRRNTANKRYR